MLKAAALIAAIGSASAVACAAEVPPLSDIIPVIEQQRNQALSNHAVSEARVVELTRENAALRAALADRDKKIADLEKQVTATKAPAEKPAE
jgi:hypothetical protein